MHCRKDCNFPASCRRPLASPRRASSIYRAPSRLQSPVRSSRSRHRNFRMPQFGHSLVTSAIYVVSQPRVAMPPQAQPARRPVARQSGDACCPHGMFLVAQRSCRILSMQGSSVSCCVESRSRVENAVVAYSEGGGKMRFRTLHPAPVCTHVSAAAISARIASALTRGSDASVIGRPITR